MASQDRQNRTIVLPISEITYTSFLSDSKKARQILSNIYQSHPELFPNKMEEGFQLNGFTAYSKKLSYRLRRIKIGEITYQIRPSFLCSYLRAKTSDVEKALFLLRFGVSFWALAYVFGRNAMFWYLCLMSLSKISLVGSSVYEPSQLPQDLLADEMHSKVAGEKIYIATTVSQGCFLGVAATKTAAEPSLQEAYGVFKAESQALDASYQPQSVNIDGWYASQKAWRNLFDKVFIIECFLQAFIKVRQRATKRFQSSFKQVADQIWNIYKADSKRQMAQRLRRLQEWVHQNLADCAMKDKVLKLCQKKKRWLAHLDCKKAYRTSNQMDRLMKAMKRHAINSQKFHGSLKRTTDNFRAFALVYNFSPSCPAVTKKQPELYSPVARLNGRVFHQNWLENLFIAASASQFNYQQNPL